MKCHEDNILNRRHPLLTELGRYDYNPIQLLTDKQSETVQTQEVQSVMTSPHTTSMEPPSLPDTIQCQWCQGVLAKSPLAQKGFQKKNWGLENLGSQDP